MKKIALVFAPVAALALSACGPDNVAACKEYVSKVNTVYEDCGQDPQLDEASQCPESLNANGAADQTAYYECLGNGYTCEDDTVTVDVDECNASS